jgi:hypothetical protein
MPDEEMDAELQAWLNRVDERWRTTGVPTYERGRLRRELDRDVEEALRAGAEPRDLMATDPDEFAEQVAAAHGHRSAERPGDPVSPGSLAVTVLAGALAGVLVVWFVVWPVLVAVAPTAGDYAFVAVDYPTNPVLVLFEALPMIALAVLGVRVARRLVARRHPALATT